MKWVTTQQLDLKPVRAGSAGIQPHCGAFHHSQALFAVAVGRNIVGKKKLLFSFFFFFFSFGYVCVFPFPCLPGMWGRGSLDGDHGIGACSLEKRNKTVVYAMGGCGESFCSLLSCLAKC
jgi:hypothetical protein